MNILKKLFGGQKTTEEVRETKEKDFDKVKYDGVRALRMHQFDLAAKFLEQALQLNAEDLECRLSFAGLHLYGQPAEGLRPVAENLGGTD